MTFLRAVATINHTSGLAEDAFVNVWHFDSDNNFATDAPEVATRLIAFYQAIDNSVLSSHVAGPIGIDVYNLADPPPRIPGHTATGTLVPAAGVPLPEEVCCCVSFQGASASGVNMKRRRGRVYIGPLTANTLTSGVASGVHISSTYTTILANAAADLAHGSGAGAGRLAVFSVRNAADVDGVPYGATTPVVEPDVGWSDAALAAGFEDVTSGWVDNALDTQRRRGVGATLRTAWTPT